MNSLIAPHLPLLSLQPQIIWYQIGSSSSSILMTLSGRSLNFWTSTPCWPVARSVASGRCWLNWNSFKEAGPMKNVATLAQAKHNFRIESMIQSSFKMKKITSNNSWNFFFVAFFFQTRHTSFINCLLLLLFLFFCVCVSACSLQALHSGTSIEPSLC